MENMEGTPQAGFTGGKDQKISCGKINKKKIKEITTFVIKVEVK